MRRVVVTGLGAVTPLGLDIPTTWESALAGRSGIGWITRFDASGFPVRVAGEVKDFDPTTVGPAKEVRRMDRNVQLALGAAQEAYADAGLEGDAAEIRDGVAGLHPQDHRLAAECAHEDLETAWRVLHGPLPLAPCRPTIGPGSASTLHSRTGTGCRHSRALRWSGRVHPFRFRSARIPHR